MLFVNDIKTYFLGFQKALCTTLLEEDETVDFVQDPWERTEGGGGGGGITCVFKKGQVIEQGGVNFSHVKGLSLPPSASALRPELSGALFEALGVSVILHPRNPYVPTTHANLRFLTCQKENEDPIWWFGGGFDLTPYYPFKEDCIHWHTMAKEACDPFGKDLYPRFKQECDNYFYLKHRQESRGIGGIFFDDFNLFPLETCFQFIQSIGEGFIKAYLPILAKRKNLPFTEEERQFQCYRRGRYVEFNLIYDRGTLFGLQSGGRAESILVSLPPEVHWNYQRTSQPGSKEAALDEFLKSQDWV